MPRRPRYDAPGRLHHVMNRGIARRTVFETRADIRYFLALLAREVRAGRLEVLCWRDHLHRAGPARPAADRGGGGAGGGLGEAVAEGLRGGSASLSPLRGEPSRDRVDHRPRDGGQDPGPSSAAGDRVAVRGSEGPGAPRGVRSRRVTSRPRDPAGRKPSILGTRWGGRCARSAPRSLSGHASWGLG